MLKATAAVQLLKIVTIFIKGILQITSPEGGILCEEREEGGKKENNVERNKNRRKERKQSEREEKRKGIWGSI